MYGFSKPLEDAFVELPPELGRELCIERRCKAALLEADLEALAARSGRVRASRTPWCDELPSTSNVSRTLGVLYVLEGSTLGARFLLRHLAPLGIDDCSTYLKSYGADLKMMWESLRQVLNRHAESYPEQQSQMVEAAQQTFERLDAWFVLCGAAEESRAA